MPLRVLQSFPEMPQEIRGKHRFNSEELRRLRRERELSIIDLAGKLGCNKTTIQRWERGDFSPKGEDVMAIATLFNVPIESLFTIDETPQEPPKKPSKRKKANR